ncbi:MAG: fatty acid desaturase [Acidobacteria bacterium]|nr:fatty acid desaturase [Acidobacteriota bacterium]
MSAKAIKTSETGASRPAIRELLSGAHRRRDAQALLTFALDSVVYAGCLAATMLARPLALKLSFSALTTLFITRLFVLAHDACHGSFLSSQPLNRVVGRLGFLPSLTPYNLWQLGHNTLHHGYTNLKGRDYVWTPLSKIEYDALPRIRRWLERFYRSGFGYGLYYLAEIWWKKMMWPARRSATMQRRFDQRDRKLVVAYAAVMCGGAWLAALATRQSPALVLLMTALLPFALWNMVMGFLIFLHHTHPGVAWYDKRAEWKSHGAQLRQAVHVAFPRGVDAFLHYIMDHTAHHVDTGVPLYQLRQAQALLEAGYPAEVPAQLFSWSYFRRLMAVCKLYDYERHCWLDFNGNITAEASLTPGWVKPKAHYKLTSLSDI